MTIYFDLDGVLADFEGYILEHFEESFSSDMWPELEANHQRLYRYLKPIPYAVKFFNSVRANNDVKILTALPSRAEFQWAAVDKASWCQTHLGDVEVLIADRSIDKQNFCKPGDVLIDDNPLNISQWQAKGGVGILFMDLS